MDNKQFPEQEENGFLTSDSSEQPVSLDTEQVLAPETVPAVSEEAAVEIAATAEEPPAVDNSPAEDTLPETEAVPAEEDIPVRGAAFMERIPDVDEDYPQDAAEEPLHDALTAPNAGEDITSHDQAMDSHGILGHGEEEPPFDMAILNDPEFDEPEEDPQEEIQDQEYRDTEDNEEFDAMFHAPAKKDAIPAHQRPTRKGRPKRKKGEGLLGIPNILATFVWLALILVIGVTLGRMLWVCAADVLAFGREDKVVTVTIYEADTMEDITNKLHEAGLIRYKSLFNLYASISDAEEDIKPGIYDLNTRYDYHALVNFMTPSSNREIVEIMIPEGYTCRQIFALLEENKVCTAVDLAAYAANGELDEYWFLQDVERGSEYCLEGFLFPDTYEFYKNDSPRNILQKMLNNFDYRFSEEMRAQIETLNANVTGGTYTVREITIVASLIEKETAGSAESPMIASVIYNRLFNWGDTPAYLNIDAAVIYAQDGESEYIDTGIDSPYNTYRNTGLTPTPIANPGLASLQAALNPATSNYYYYVLNPATGSHQFSTTLEEHEGYRAQFAAAAAAEE